MKIRVALAIAGVLLMAQPAFAVLRNYDLNGDQSTLFPTDGTILRPNTNSGGAVLNDPGGGTVTLLSLTVTNTFTDVVGGTITSGVPGTTVVLDSVTTAAPTPGQTGAGNTTSQVLFGGLSGWSQTGRLVCTTIAPGGGGSSSCVPFVGFEGVGPPAPLNGDTFNVDPWDFAVDGSAFDAASEEFVNLTAGAVTANLEFGGSVAPFQTVPSLPVLGVAGLGAAMLYLGARAIRRRSS